MLRRTDGSHHYHGKILRRRFMDAALIENLKNPALYNHPVDQFELFETHISWVLLTGKYAYKIKKPVNFGFLDFSTLEKRKFCCTEEIRLNQRLAPELYIGVVPIYGSSNHPSFKPQGDPIEYAVKMVQFDQSALLTEVLLRHELLPDMIDQLADRIATYHQNIPSTPKDNPYGSPEHVLDPMIHNFETIRPLLSQANDLEELEQHEQWVEETHQKFYALLAQRKRNGFIRECHGDIHLGNIAWINQKMTLFDCIEFNKPYYWIDVISDLAFLMMDLQSRNLPQYANQLLNRYLEQTGDYAALPLLPFYAAYRAMVRAKVSILRLNQSGLSLKEQEEARQRYRDYVQLAISYTLRQKAHLMIMHGVSGSGKSQISAWLANKSNAIRLRSDVERKRLFGLKPQESSYERGIDIYTEEGSRKTFQRLAECAYILCQHGFRVIIDATFLKKSHRMSFYEVAKKLSIPFRIIACITSETQAKKWVDLRQKNASDPSEATLGVLENQIQQIEPITELEKAYTIQVSATNPVEWEKALYGI